MVLISSSHNLKIMEADPIHPELAAYNIGVL